uniref:FAD binding / monooxygenase/ oxidoreductase/ oxidoreductase, acting on paired donors, with incorporation or reduction of molecular oxygen, NADH or NADPH as one donor, and incorporation of one atom... n=1 Tax=Arundo donax TaxID=35708 RepID=A0A0A9EW94_ARUDO
MLNCTNDCTLQIIPTSCFYSCNLPNIGLGTISSDHQFGI